MIEKDDICCSKNFYGSLDSNYDFFLYSSSVSNKNTVDFDIPPILETKYIKSHYLCPKCYFFPFITFQNQYEICYTCKCRKEEVVTLEKLFEPKNEYIILINNDDNIHGLRCIHKEISHKFKYYCTNCHVNLCKKCCESHSNKNHILIIFDFNNKNTYAKINKIIEFLNNKKNNTFNNDSYESSFFCQINLMKLI